MYRFLIVTRSSFQSIIFNYVFLYLYILVNLPILCHGLDEKLVFNIKKKEYTSVVIFYIKKYFNCQMKV